MSDQLVPDGQYYIQLYGSEDVLTATVEAFALMPITDRSENAVWTIVNIGIGGSDLGPRKIDTIVNIGIGGSDLGPRTYLGSSADPRAPTHQLSGVSEPFAWQIEPAPEAEGAVILSPLKSEGSMELCLSPLRVYPPRVGWGQPQNARWKLIPLPATRR